MGGASMGGFEDLSSQEQSFALAFMVDPNGLEKASKDRWYDGALKIFGIDNPTERRQQRFIAGFTIQSAQIKPNIHSSISGGAEN